MLAQIVERNFLRVQYCTLGCNVGVSVTISINVTGIDVITALFTPERLQADPCRLIGQDINQAILEFVHWQIGTNKSLLGL